jgi:hypothetical protein
VGESKVAERERWMYGFGEGVRGCLIMATTGYAFRGGDMGTYSTDRERKPRTSGRRRRWGTWRRAWGAYIEKAGRMGAWESVNGRYSPPGLREKSTVAVFNRWLSAGWAPAVGEKGSQ